MTSFSMDLFGLVVISVTLALLVLLLMAIIFYQLHRLDQKIECLMHALDVREEEEAYRLAHR